MIVWRCSGAFRALQYFLRVHTFLSIRVRWAWPPTFCRARPPVRVVTRVMRPSGSLAALHRRGGVSHDEVILGSGSPKPVLVGNQRGSPDQIVIFVGLSSYGQKPNQKQTIFSPELSHKRTNQEKAQTKTRRPTGPS